MPSAYDIFETHSDGSVVWHIAIVELADAIAFMHRMAANSPNRFCVIDVLNGKTVASSDRLPAQSLRSIQPSEPVPASAVKID